MASDTSIRRLSGQGSETGRLRIFSGILNRILHGYGLRWPKTMLHSMAPTCARAPVRYAASYGACGERRWKPNIKAFCSTQRVSELLELQDPVRAPSFNLGNSALEIAGQANLYVCA